MIVFDIHHASGQQLVARKLAPERDLGKLAVSELQREEICFGVENMREQRAIAAFGDRTTNKVAKTKVQADLGFNAFDRRVEQINKRAWRVGMHCVGWLIDLDDRRTSLDERLQLAVDNAR